VRLATLALCALAACTEPAPARPPPEPAPAPRGPVVVTIVVDQLAAWIAAERLERLEGGGFARLRREGTWVREARYPHACSETAPGHALLFTGALPRDSGIFAGDRIDPRSGRAASILRDPATHALGPEGPLASPASSLAALRVPTLADRLRAARPDAGVFALSLKDRGALFAGGSRPDAAIWYAPEADVFITSSAVADELPPWARPLAGRAALARHRAAPWTLLDPRWVAANARTADGAPGEGDVGGFGRAFPHDFAASSAPSLAFRASPRGDDALLALALAALDARPPSSAPTWLSLSLSSHDLILHVFGPDSWEAWDEERRLDEALGRFFAELDRRFGPAGWSVVLTADHGSTPLAETAGDARARPWCAGPDRWQRPCKAGVRVDGEALADALRAAARAALGPGDWVLGVVEPYVTLTAGARALDAPRREALLRALVAAAERHPGVHRVFSASPLAGSCPPASDERLEALVCRAIPEGAGDLYVTLEPGSYFETGYAPGAGTNHGSPWLHDRAVPLVVRAPGRARAGVVLDGPLPVVAFTRTVSSLLGIAPPPGAADAPDLSSLSSP